MKCATRTCYNRVVKAKFCHKCYSRNRAIGLRTLNQKITLNDIKLFGRFKLLSSYSYDIKNSGLYAFYKEDKIVYIGASKINMVPEIRRHMYKNWIFTHVNYLVHKGRDLHDIEYRLINHFKPRYNVHKMHKEPTNKIRT